MARRKITDADRRCVRRVITIPAGLLELAERESKKAAKRSGQRRSVSAIIREELAERYGLPDLAEPLIGGRPRKDE